MPGIGTVDIAFALGKKMEKHQGKMKGLHKVFINLEKAYYRVQEVGRCTREKGVPEKLGLLQNMYRGQN